LFGFRVFIPILILTFAVGFYFAGFTYLIVCPKCNGSGEIWGMWYDFNQDTWVQGYHECPTCNGSGKVWVYSVMTISLISFLVCAFCFILFFGLEYIFVSIQLERNPWVKDVKEMSFWFNPAYFLWLFHVNRKKWSKFVTATTLLITVIVILNFWLVLAPTSTSTTLWLHMTNNDFWSGLPLGIALLIPFAVAWNQDYKQTEIPKSFLKRCVRCNKEIPIASEECPYCGQRQT
jgi:hypothetical protein